MKRIDLDNLNSVALDLESITMIRKGSTFVSIRAVGTDPLVIDTSEPGVIFCKLLEAFDDDC